MTESNKATEAALNELHAQIARTLSNIIADPEKASAAHITAAITFLKNNNITADPAANEDLKGLNDQLQERRRKRAKLTPADLDVIEGSITRSLTGTGE